MQDLENASRDDLIAEVERLQLASTKKLFALEELEIGRWPREMCVWVMDEGCTDPRIVPPQAVEGFFRIFNINS